MNAEQARQEKAQLYSRWKQARQQTMDARDGGERRRQQERARLLGEMYREACQRVRRLEGGESAPEKKRSPQVDMNVNCGAVWADLEGVTWRKLEGRAWSELPDCGSGRQMQQIRQLVRAAMGLCSPAQLECLNAYYGEGLTLEEIGRRRGVDASTVSRTLKRGRERVERYVTAKLLLGRCVDGRGRFDYMKFLHSTAILTERQKEMVYLILARDTSYRDIARWMERTPSTVARTAGRAEEKLGALAVTVDQRRSAVTVERRDWQGRSEKQLAQELGLSPAFYYRVVRRGERADGVPLLHCAILHRLAAGESAAGTAAGLGCSQELVKRVRRSYAAAPLPEFRDDYRPRKPRRAALPDNPFAAAGDAVIDRIDAATYQALQKRFGGDDHAGA